LALAILVALGTVVCFALLIVRRLRRGLPCTQAVCQRAFFTGFEFGGAITGALFPTVWVIARNALKGWQTGDTRFVIAGNLPPGVEEQDLVAVLFVGTAILLINGFYRFLAYWTRVDPESSGTTEE
jgi:hypothetical protein